MANAGDDTRHRLLEAAGEVFAENGFRAATVREICSRAQANVAAVNYHFGDKERLYVETVQHAHVSGREGPPPILPDAAPSEKLWQYVNAMLSRLFDERRPAWHAQLMAREMAEPSKACEELVESYIRHNFELLDGLLVELLPPATPAAERHLVGFSIVGMCMHFKIHRPIGALLVGDEEIQALDVARLTDHVTQFSLAALGHVSPLFEALQGEQHPG